MTREEETNERNACDEWFHERGGASIHEAWIERARRAAASEASAEPIYQECINEAGLWMDTSKRTYDDIAAGKLSSKGARIVYANPRPADYASLHMTPEQAAKEAK